MRISNLLPVPNMHSEKSNLPSLTVVNQGGYRSVCKKAGRLREDIFDRLDIKASFYVRLHATEYNPHTFEKLSNFEEYS